MKVKVKAKRKPKVVRVRQVSVNVAKNDSVDIRCGGPQMLGFDFSVPADEWSAKEIEKFIREALADAELPCLGILVGRPEWKAGGRVWTRIGMTRCINNYKI